MAIAEKSFNRIEDRIRGTLKKKRFPMVSTDYTVLISVSLKFFNLLNPVLEVVAGIADWEITKQFFFQM